MFSYVSSSLHAAPEREELRDLTKEFEKTEDDLKSLQSGVGQIVGEVLRQLTEDKCEGCGLMWVWLLC